MTLYKKIFHFNINRHDGAAQYDFQIVNALSGQSNDFSYILKDSYNSKNILIITNYISSNSMIQSQE